MLRVNQGEAESPLILLYIVDAGGGHRAAANAFVAAAAERKTGFRLEIRSISDALEPIDWIRRATRVSMEETYNNMVRRGWTLGLVPLLRGMQWIIRRAHNKVVALLSEDLSRRRPALVVSLAPNFNTPLRDAVRRAHPGIPFIVHLTDYADFPPNFWMVPGLDYLVVGGEEAVEQALGIGLTPDRISRHSGMPLHPRFYPRSSPDRALAVRRELGIEDGAFVSLLLFGGKGTPEMAALSRQILAAVPEGHVIAVGGSNPRLVKRLTAIAAAEPRLHAFGFSDRVADLMAASDVLVTKPGPGSVAEALHQRVPIVTIANNRTVPQERFNALYLADRGFGYVERRWRDLPARVQKLAQDPLGRRAMVERQMALPENRAVYESLDLLGELVQRASGLPSAVVA
jgi:UDP-N-acetylglucosamine:LPS N-acetylglucosamine transferase